MHINHLLVTQDNKLIKKYLIDEFDRFLDAMKVMAQERFDQPYRVLANVAKVYSYEYPQLLRRLVESIPFPSSDSIEAILLIRNSC